MQQFNVILIVIDGGRVDRISKFPIFQKLQKAGTFFSHTITNAPYTLASMNSIFPTKKSTNPITEMKLIKRSYFIRIKKFARQSKSPLKDLKKVLS